MKFTASALVLSAFVSSAFAATCSREYTVVEGDYCDAISAAHNVSTYQLAVVNKDVINEACSNLAIGQKLCLGYESQDCTTTYRVEEGDYCELIASKYGINTTMLYTNNPQIDDNCYNLYIDEVLCVASTELVTPPPEGFVLPGSTLESDTYDDSTADDDTTDTDPPVDDSVITSTTAAVATTSRASSAAAAATTTPPKNAAVNNAAEDDDDEEGDDDECED